MKQDNAAICHGARRRVLASVAIALALVLAAPGCVFVYVGGWRRFKAEYAEKEVQPSERWYTASKVLLLDIDGLILSADLSDFFIHSESTVAAVKERLLKAEKDPLVRAVVLRVNSPGGGVTASDIVYRELMDFKAKTRLPIVACIMDVGASGGYYIAMASDRIIAHPTAVTGSIGVIMRYLTFDGLMKKFGVSDVAIKSGAQKDMGSPFRPVTESDREIFQSTIDDMYERFVTVVDAGRPKLKADQIRPLADGRIYTAAQAKASGLIDEVGYLKDAIAEAKRLAGVRDARVVTYHRPSEYRNNVYSRCPTVPRGQNSFNLVNVDMGGLLERNRPMFMYLWLPEGGG